MQQFLEKQKKIITKPKRNTITISLKNTYFFYCDTQFLFKNKPSITQHTPTITSRLLSEKDTQSSSYDKDADMKSVKENFDRQTSQRFEEYEERMKEKRQKRKEQRDKDIQKIIVKDKMEKNLAEKVEKGCLKCGCGLGGVAASVGLFGGLGIYGWKTAALATAKEAAVTEATALATQAGMDAVVSEMNELLVAFPNDLGLFDLTKIVNESNFSCGSLLHESAMKLASSSCNFVGTERTPPFCNTIWYGKDTNFVRYANAGSTAFEKTLASQKELLKTAKVGAVEATYGGCQTAIIASVVAILVIVLVMIIIYLVLRYRRKKKMKKKAQYTKLLNE
ncbi:hypothetical protein PFMG_00870 [Plasmodium falciparum IGH-CR14]|uniref:Rifin n=1 Tax=Plasmodium falciparum IGH-CR14 TaxID=580059 RepID=A0A0L1I650_PLAFA|nr:hypothetical protein PFMG_00870 [Plasmodium falciparum IGH-CR14]